MLTKLIPATRLSMLFLFVAASGRGAVIIDDFESNAAGVLPQGWSDVGSAPGATPGSPIPSAVVINTTNAFGAATRAVQIVDARHTSQGIYRTIPDLPNVRVEMDLRIDQFALGSQVSADDWAWDVALIEDQADDFAFRPSMGVYASALTEGVRTFSAGLSAPTQVDEFALGGSTLSEGVWYRLRAIFDRVNGVIHAEVTDIATGSNIVSNLRQIPDWAGQASEPDFTILAIFDGELGTSITRNNVTTIDNVRISGPLPMIAISRTPPQQITLNAYGIPGTSFNLEFINSLPASTGNPWGTLQQIDFDFAPFQRVESISASPTRFYRLSETNSGAPSN